MKIWNMFWPLNKSFFYRSFLINNHSIIKQTNKQFLPLKLETKFVKFSNKKNFKINWQMCSKWKSMKIIPHTYIILTYSNTNSHILSLKHTHTHEHIRSHTNEKWAKHSNQIHERERERKWKKSTNKIFLIKIKIVDLKKKKRRTYQNTSNVIHSVYRFIIFYYYFFFIFATKKKNKLCKLALLHGATKNYITICFQYW